MKKLIILHILIMCMILPQGWVHAEENSSAKTQNPTGTLKTKIQVRPEKVLGQVKRSPAIGMMLECEITDGSITFLSFFTEDGINVVIEEIDGSQWSGFVSPEYPSMSFDGESGEYSIECTTLDGRVYVGEFKL